MSFHVLTERKVLFSLLLLAAIFAAYFNTLSAGFIMDDFSLVVRNYNIKSWANIPHIFASSLWDSEGYTRGLYRPLAVFSFLVEYAFAGARPFLYHLDNVLLHFLCCVAAFLLLREMLPGSDAPAAAALLFAVHPVHTEAVSWVSCRGDLLATLFSILSVFFFIKKPGKKVYLYLSLLSFFLALLSKESAAAAPVLLFMYLLLFENAPLPERLKDAVFRMLPFVPVFAAYLALRYYALGALGPEGADQAFTGAGPYGRLLTMSAALFEYLRLSVLPFDMRTDYLFPPPPLLSVKALLAPAVLLAAVVYTWKAKRPSRPLLFGVFWFCIALLPVMNIIPSPVIMAERALYLPSLGLCLAAALALSRFKSPAPLLLVIVPFIALSNARNEDWHDQDRLVRSSFTAIKAGIGKHPDYGPLYRQAARIQFRFFPDGPEKEKALGDALTRLAPDDEVHEMLADYYTARDPERALEEIKKAIEIQPLGNYYNHAAKLLARLKRYPEALAMADEAVRINPVKSIYYVNKGNILLECGMDAEALRTFEKAAEINPEDFDAYLGQGIALDSMRQFGVAVERLRQAASLQPDMPDMHYFLAVACLDAGRTEEAAAELSAALRLKPDYSEAAALLEKIRR